MLNSFQSSVCSKAIAFSGSLWAINFSLGFPLNGIDMQDVQALFQGIPSAWLPQPEIVAALMDFIGARASFVGQNIRKMLVDHGDLQPQLELGG